MIFDINNPIEHFQPITNSFGKITLIDCNDSFTHNLVQSFLKVGASVTVLNSLKVTIEDVSDHLGDYLVLSPGPGMPKDAGILKEAISEFIGDIPMLGICLGMQAINEYYGGKTVPAPVPVHGKTCMISHDKTGIFSDIASPTTIARYHSLMISEPNEKIQIQSVYNEIIMAFRSPDRVAAVQFHPESFMTMQGRKMISNFLEGIM